MILERTNPTRRVGSGKAKSAEKNDFSEMPNA
jgi:hypothetical protein